MPLTPDLSFIGLDEFVNKPVVKNRKSDEEVSKVVRKSDDSPIIEDWVSDNEEENVSQPKNEKKIVKPSIAKIYGKKFNTGRPKAVVNAVKGNNVNYVKASACWVWKPKTKVLDHVSKHNSASTILITFDYINAQGNMFLSLQTINEIDGGYVALGKPKGGKTQVKCTIKTATKDETSGILKSFITGIENLVDHKVKSATVGLRVLCGADVKGLWYKQDDNAGQARKDPKSSHDDGSKPSSDDGKKVDEDPRKDSESNDQEKEDNVNSTNNVNTASTNEVNTVDGKTSIELPDDPNMPALEDYSIFDFTKRNGYEVEDD
ncbi:hypothetical protein Tco_1081799 [Tanacetum coccineum]|uniref:Uncharacterized protein n=1 Tax=Tanacetum coccineum TaxID=301880 RepID=A0ABQ5HZU8_9ASTR